jgi:hypothetical protein
LTEDFSEVRSEPADAFDVSGMIHDGFLTLKNIMVYGHARRTRTRYFLWNWVEKVNAKKINLAFITNLNFVKCQGQTLSYVPMTKKLQS